MKQLLPLTYGIHWGIWDIDFNKSIRIIDVGQPFILTCQGQWGKSMINENIKDKGKVGHSIVVYGYETTTKKVLICLSWGSSFSDRWIDLN